MSNVTLILGIIFLAITSAPGSLQNTSTAEERARWTEITHKLENDLLDYDLDKRGEWAVNRLSDVHDIHVALCPKFLFEFNEMKYPYAHALRRQFMLASAAFVIENPTNADHRNQENRTAQNLTAVGSVLKAYRSILQKKPSATYKLLDDLLNRQKDGKLAEYVKKKCP
jgi:hypothetical protein